jgi:paraquat-inducible protein B
MAEDDIPTASVPESRTRSRKRTRLSLVWIIPIVAAVIGAWVAAVKIMSEGPKITITLRTAEGLEAGKTKVHYNGVDVGAVTAIRLTPNHKGVVATVQMAPKTEDFLVEDTKFWVVSPRISGASISGLGTIISGAYLGMEIGKSTKKQHDFTALETPPVVTGDIPGRFFILKTTDLGSVDYGTPVYFRRLKVGQVASYALDKDGNTLTVKAYVYAPYDQFVTPESRFWQASGIDLSLTASGLTLQTQSVLSMLVGGLAFETPEAARELQPAAANTEFTLYSNRAEAFKPPPNNPQTYLLVFNQSVRGLESGAPVEFRGIRIGEVTDVHAEVDLKTFQFLVLVTISVDPARLGVKIAGGGTANTGPQYAPNRQLIDAMVAHGLRAQLRTGSLITGALYVAVDFFPDAPPFKMDWSQHPVRLATVPGKLEGVEANVASLIKKLDQVPYREIGEDTRKTLAGFDQTLDSARRALDHADALVESNSGLNQELTNTLREIDSAARSIRVLSDYLERHPEALIRGKTEEKK